MKRIGVLALQGGFSAHEESIRALGALPVRVRAAEDLRAVDALILPGGESTTQLDLLHRASMWEALRTFPASGKPVLTTCAGTILAAKVVSHPAQESLGWLDIEVQRNAWGRQVASFEAQSDDGKHPLVFIRAPRIVRVGSGVEILATFQGEPIAVRQGAVVAATFHPELTSDLAFHRLALGSWRE